jgi:hypothetical protein
MAAEVYRVEVRRASALRRLGSWVATLVQASSMVSTTPPWRDEARIVEVDTGRVATVVRNLVGGETDDVGQVAVDVGELTQLAFERLWLPERVPGERAHDGGDASS